jgi:Acetyltransferase (GNAT) family
LSRISQPENIQRLSDLINEIYGELVGSVYVNLMGKGVGEFGMLVADRDSRGNGIGSALVKDARRCSGPLTVYDVDAADKRTRFHCTAWLSASAVLPGQQTQTPTLRRRSRPRVVILCACFMPRRSLEKIRTTSDSFMPETIERF